MDTNTNPTNTDEEMPLLQFSARRHPRLAADRPVIIDAGNCRTPGFSIPAPPKS